jgi:hypothetical protein
MVRATAAQAREVGAVALWMLLVKTHRLAVRIVPLHRDFDGDAFLRRSREMLLEDVFERFTCTHEL